MYVRLKEDVWGEGMEVESKRKH